MDAERVDGLVSAWREFPVIGVAALRAELEELVLPLYFIRCTALVCFGTSGTPAVPIDFFTMGVAEFGT